MVKLATSHILDYKCLVNEIMGEQFSSRQERHDLQQQQLLDSVSLIII